MTEEKYYEKLKTIQENLVNDAYANTDIVSVAYNNNIKEAKEHYNAMVEVNFRLQFADFMFRKLCKNLTDEQLKEAKSIEKSLRYLLKYTQQYLTEKEKMWK